MRRGTRWGVILAAMWLAGSIAAAGYAFASGDAQAGGADEVLGPGPVTVTLHVQHSRFAPASLVVRQHATVTFRVVNHDPIGHELIVGDDGVHAIHSAGTHEVHGAVAGEVSIAPGETAATTYTFHTTGVTLFACHLPGHVAYGMVGEVVVKPAAGP